MINVAIVGIGYWGEKLVRNFKKINKVKIKYLCDLKYSQEEKDQEAKIINSYKEILKDSAINAVIIATDIPTHYQIIKDSLSAGKNVFVEKLLSLDPEQAEELINLAKEKKLVLFVDYTFLYSSAIKEIKNIIESGRIGKVFSVRADRLNFGKFQKGNDVIEDLFSHDISILYYLLEDSPKKVLFLSSKNFQSDSDDCAAILMEYNSGAIANINLSWINYEKERRYYICGTKGMVVWDDLESENKIKLIDDSGKISFPKIDLSVEPLSEVCRDFIEACNKKIYFSSNTKTSLEAVKIYKLINKKHG
jgi:predicted dehydrogenase